MSIDCLQSLVDAFGASSGGVWSVVNDSDVGTVWIVSDRDAANPIALLDYNSGDQNEVDARFIVCAHNNLQSIASELRFLRRRVEELLANNTKEVELRISLQNELKQVRGE